MTFEDSIIATLTCNIILNHFQRNFPIGFYLTYMNTILPVQIFKAWKQELTIVALKIQLLKPSFSLWWNPYCFCNRFFIHHDLQTLKLNNSIFVIFDEGHSHLCMITLQIFKEIKPARISHQLGWPWKLQYPLCIIGF